MAVYRKIRVDLTWNAERIVTEIKNQLALSDSVEVRCDPTNQARLLLIVWRSEHVAWEEHHEVY